jgi:hypothetical protein
MTKHLKWIFFGASFALLAMLVFIVTQNSSPVSSNAVGSQEKTQSGLNASANESDDTKEQVGPPTSDDRTLHIMPSLFGDPVSDMRTYSIPLVYSYRGRVPPRTTMVLQGVLVGSFGTQGFLVADPTGQMQVLCEMSSDELEDAAYYYKRGDVVQIMGKYYDGSLLPVMRGCTMSDKKGDVVELPNEGLPKYIADALGTPDLAPGDESRGKRELVLGSAGQEQFIPALSDEDCTGSGGCNWKILDADTQKEILPDGLGQGELFKTQKITNGYYDIVVVGGTAVVEDLDVYEFSNGMYKNTACYERNINPEGPAVSRPCT